MKNCNDITPTRIFIVILVITLLLALFPACNVTKQTTHNCERIENGQKCLMDHSCCDVYKKRGF